MSHQLKAWTLVVIVLSSLTLPAVARETDQPPSELNGIVARTVEMISDQFDALWSVFRAALETDQVEAESTVDSPVPDFFPEPEPHG